MTQTSLVLQIPAALEEAVIDVMLDNEAAARAGFVSRDVRFHGDAAIYHSVIEQIRGYTKVVEITLTLPEAAIRELLATLAAELPGRGLGWKIVPIIETGTI
ncbi:DUF3240 family protein [Rhodoplanes sp. SY1]|uniref:DUF3240 family protein n=1 Tax=Rhodoplanes sp. SY1 TaxID=3166646 RepID=UPI0038B5D587